MPTGACSMNAASRASLSSSAASARMRSPMSRLTATKWVRRPVASRSGETVASWKTGRPSLWRLTRRPCQVSPRSIADSSAAKNAASCRSPRSSSAPVRPTASSRPQPVRRVNAGLT